MSSGDVMVICPYHHIQSVLIEIKSTITAWVTWSQMDSPGLHSMFSSEQCNMGLQLSLAAVIVDSVCSQPDNMTELQWDMTSIVQYLFIWTWSRFAILFTRMANSFPFSLALIREVAVAASSIECADCSRLLIITDTLYLDGLGMQIPGSLSRTYLGWQDSY